jgi:hypothetical protein
LGAWEGIRGGAGLRWWDLGVEEWGAGGRGRYIYTRCFLFLFHEYMIVFFCLLEHIRIYGWFPSIFTLGRVHCTTGCVECNVSVYLHMSNTLKIPSFPRAKTTLHESPHTSPVHLFTYLAIPPYPPSPSPLPSSTPHTPSIPPIPSRSALSPAEINRHPTCRSLLDHAMPQRVATLQARNR